MPAIIPRRPSPPGLEALKELQKKTYFCLGEAKVGRGVVSVSCQCVAEMDRELPCSNVRLLERQSSASNARTVTSRPAAQRFVTEVDPVIA
jgi:hypothetical protein